MNTPRKHWGPTVRRQIWEVQDRRCFYCSRELETWTGQHMHLDHVDPFGRKGPDELENIVAACIGCNLEKSDKEFPELLRGFDGNLPGAIVASQIAAARERGEGPTLTFHEPFNWRRWMSGQIPAMSRDMQSFWDDSQVITIVCPVALSRAKMEGEPELIEGDALRLGIALGGLACMNWELLSRRPYYNLYPVVTDALVRSSLEVTPEVVFGGPFSLAICFPVGRELERNNCRIRSVIAAYIDIESTYSAFKSLSTGCLAICSIDYEDQNGTTHLATQLVDVRQSLDNQVVGKMMLQDASRVNRLDMIRVAWGIAVGTRLLAQDPEFCEPILLSKDRKRDLTPEQQEAAVRRAIKRTGMRGFTIGRDCVSSPHVRRPHFAIRWTGKGRTVPRLVPVKGSIVRRSELLKIPTGYKTYDDESSA